MSILEMVQKHGNYREISSGEYAGPCPQCGGAIRFRIRPAENSGKCSSCDFVLVACPETCPAAAGAPALFDAEKMQRLISDTYSRVMSLCPTGACEWLEENKGDVWRHLKAADKAVDAAFEAEDEQALMRNLNAWEKYHLRAWEIFNERPEVIER